MSQSNVKSEIEVKSNIYSGTYGSTHQNGTILHVQLLSKNDISFSKEKEVIFVLDLSGSMANEIIYMINSLKAFRNAIVGKTPQEMESLSEIERDKLFRQSLNVKIIPFSDDVIDSSIWISESSDKTFDETLSNLNTRSMTNMSSGIIKAFEMINPNRVTWIIIMTDGESNMGKYRTSQSFQFLATTKPLNTKIITLGYGQQFNPEVLSKIGEFTYMDTNEKMPLIFGNIAGEIMTSWAINCTLDIIENNMSNTLIELHDDTIIPSLNETNIGDNIQNNGQIIVGERMIGTLYDGRSYNFIYLISNKLSRNKNELIKRYKDKIYIQYKHILNNKWETIISSPENNNDSTNDIPDDVCKYYFNAERGRLIYKLYCAIRENSIGKIINDVKSIINTWTNPIAYEYKDEISQLIENISKFNEYSNTHSYNSNQYYSSQQQHQSMSMLFKATGTQRQDNYITPNLNSANRQSYVDSSIQSANYYTLSSSSNKNK